MNNDQLCLCVGGVVCTGFVLAVSHWEVCDAQQDFGGLEGVHGSHQTDTSESSSQAHET